MRDQSGIPTALSIAEERLKKVYPLVVLALFGVALIVLYRQFHTLDLQAVSAAIVATGTSQMAWAIGLTAAGYITLIGYDRLALAYIGRSIPLPTVAAASFVGYAVGNTVGLSALSGGAIRYRIYSRYGLDAADIAKIALYCALAFSSGEMLSALFVTAAEPGAATMLLPLSPGVLRGLAIAALVAMLAGAFFLSIGGLSFSIGHFHFRMPEWPLLASQIVLSLADLSLASAVLYALLPPEAGISWIAFLGLFVVAVAAGVLSHVPGGAGVFEAVMAAGLAGSVPHASLAAALLLYRLVYYVLPFFCAVLLLGGMEWRRAHRPSPAIRSGLSTLTRAADIPVAAIPYVLSATAFIVGAFLTVTSLFPFRGLASSAFLETAPVEALELTAIAGGSLGMALVVLSLALGKRVREALYVTVALLVAGAVVEMVRTQSWTVAAAMLVAALACIVSRDRFDRHSRLSVDVLTPQWLMLIAGVACAGFFVLFFAHKDAAYSQELWWQFARDGHASRALRAGTVAAAVALSGILFYALRPAIGRIEAATVDDPRVAGIIAANDNADACIAFSGAKQILIGPDGRSLAMIGRHGRSLIALDDPVADDGSIDGVIEAVVAMARQINCRPIFYQISPRFIPSFLDNGFRLYKLGEEAVVDLETFSLDGKARRGLRGSHNRAERDGLTFDIRQPPHDPAFLDTLRAISDEWLADKGGVEKDFSVGRFSDAYIGRFPVAVVSLAGTPVAFANLLVTDTRAMATIDLMRHRDDAPTSVMEFLFVEIMLALKADGFAAFSLGLAPLSGFETMRRKRLWEHSAQLVYEHGNRFYSFKGLRAFKDKFKPEWVPRYAAAYSTVDFVAGLADATALINAPSKPAESGDDGP